MPLQAVTSAGNLNIGLNGLGVAPLMALTQGILTTYAGNGTPGHAGDGGPATNSEFYEPQGMAMDNAGNLYVSDFYNMRVQRIDATNGIATTYAGTGNTNSISGQGDFSGDGGPATAVDLDFPEGIGLDSAGNLYIADHSNFRVRRVDAQTGIITTVASNGDKTDSGDGGLATNADFRAINDVKFDSRDNMYIADSLSIRRVDATTGIITTITGSGADAVGVPATATSIASPTGIVLDGSGNLYIGSYVAEVIRKINVSQAALIWPTPTTVGSTDDIDDPETAILTDIGNYAMNVPFSSSPADPVTTLGWALDSTSTCSTEGLNPLTLASGKNCTLPVDFTPTMSGANIGTMVLTDNSLNNPASTQTITLAGTGVGNGSPATPQAVLTPRSLTYTATATAPAASQSITLSNPSGATLIIGNVAITGTNASAFEVSATSCGSTLAAGANCVIHIVFTATTAGTYNADLTVTDNASPLSVQTATLTGTVTSFTSPGAPIATLPPASLTYSATTGTTSASQTATLTNSGTATLNISGITLTGANNSEFAISTNTCGTTLAAGAICAISVTFAPDSAASFTAAISVADDAAGSPQTSTLIGTGTAVAAAADFTVSATPPTQSVTSGSTASYTVNVASTSGSFTDAVALTASGLPPGATVTFSPISVTPGSAGAQSTMMVQTAIVERAHLLFWKSKQYSSISTHARLLSSCGAARWKLEITAC